jgi:hypothetical protein
MAVRGFPLSVNYVTRQTFYKGLSVGSSKCSEASNEVQNVDNYGSNQVNLHLSYFLSNIGQAVDPTSFLLKVRRVAINTLTQV